MATELGSASAAEKGPRAYLSSKAHRKPSKGQTRTTVVWAAPHRLLPAVLPAAMRSSQALPLPFRDPPRACLASEADSSAFPQVAASVRGPSAAGPVQPPWAPCMGHSCALLTGLSSGTFRL